MARNRKTRPVEGPEIGSRKLDKALGAVLTAELKGAQAVWEEDRACRRKVSKLKRSEVDSIAVEIAKTEIESLKKQANIVSGFGEQHVMGGEGGPGGLNMNDPAIFRNHSIVDFSACSEQDFRPPYARRYAWGLPTDPGVDGEMTADRKKGNLVAACRIFDYGGRLKVSAGFWIDVRLNVPYNPLLEAIIAGGGVQRPPRFGSMRLIADFAPLQTAWIVASRELLASSSGEILMAVVPHIGYRVSQGHPGPGVSLWHTSRLWKRAAVNTEQYNPLRDAQYASSRLFTSPWFGANSMTKYSAYVGVAVDVEGDVNPQDRAQYGFAYGSIGGSLSFIKIEQCLE